MRPATTVCLDSFPDAVPPSTLPGRSLSANADFGRANRTRRQAVQRRGPLMVSPLSTNAHSIDGFAKEEMTNHA
jgi:hypothetical protein